MPGSPLAASTKDFADNQFLTRTAYPLPKTTETTGESPHQDASIMTNNDMDSLYRLRARLESVFTRRRCDMSLHAVSAFAANNGFAIVEPRNRS